MRSFSCCLLWLNTWAIVGVVTAPSGSQIVPEFDKRTDTLDADGYSAAESFDPSTLGRTLGGYGTNLSVVPAPAGFKVMIKYFDAIPMPTHSTWGYILNGIGKGAILGRWDTAIPPKIDWPAMHIEPSVNAPRLRFQDVIFTLIRCFVHMNIKKDYRPLQFRTLIEGQGILGEGIIFNPDVGGQANAASGGMGAAISTSNTTTGLTLPLSPEGAPSKNSSLSTVPAVGDMKIGIQWQYFQGAKPFEASSIYWASMMIITVGARVGKLNESAGAQAFYTANQDYTLTVYPTSPAARENLHWQYVIQALCLLPPFMSDVKEFAEGQGLIRVDGRIMGKMRVLRGPPDGQDLDIIRPVRNVTLNSDSIAIS